MPAVPLASTNASTLPNLSSLPQSGALRMTDLASAVATLDHRIATLDAQVPADQAQVEAERRQASRLARVIYLEPSSLLVAVAEAANLGDVMGRLSEASAFGAEAHSVMVSLATDSARLAQERKERQSATVERARLMAELVGLSSDQVWRGITLWERANQALTFPPSPGPPSPHPFVWPVSHATIGQPFGPTLSWMEPPYEGYPHFHTGIDLDAPFGSPINAAAVGVVVAVGFDPYGYGRYVVLGHAGGLATLYGHLSATQVKVGDQITQGQVIGREGSTGNSTGPHLHFEVRSGFVSKEGGVPVNPVTYLPPGP